MFFYENRTVHSIAPASVPVGGRSVFMAGFMQLVSGPHQAKKVDYPYCDLAQLARCST